MASIIQRGENSYRITVSNGYNSNGKKLTKTKTITLDPKLTEKQRDKEIQKAATLFEEEVEKGTYLDGGKLTFDDFIKKWLVDYAEKNLAPKTLHCYKTMLNDRIIPVLGHLKLDKIQPNHLIDFYNNLAELGIREDSKYVILPKFNDVINERGLTIKDLTEKSNLSLRGVKSILLGKNTMSKNAKLLSKTLNVKINKIFKPVGELKPLSGSTIQKYHRIISSILQDAVQWQLILANPASRVKPPKVIHKEAAAFDEAKSALLLQALDNQPLKYRTLGILALVSGLRRGELVALQWKNIDMKSGVLEVNGSAQYLPGQGMSIKETKNISSMRKVSLPSLIISLLKALKTEQSVIRLKCGDQWIKDSDFIFTQWNGGIMHVDTVSKWFREFLLEHNKCVMNDKAISKDKKEKYLLPVINFHGLRHTAATLLINKGLNVRALSSRMGHANTSTTLNIYSHALQSADKQAADIMEDIFNPKKKNKAKSKRTN